MQNKDHEETCAALFHGMAGSLIESHGFVLAHHLKLFGMFAVSKAFYRSARGLALNVVLDPNESGTALLNFGREWYANANGKGMYLSNRYSNLARRFGLELPAVYTLRREDYLMVIEQMAEDVKSRCQRYWPACHWTICWRWNARSHSGPR